MSGTARRRVAATLALLSWLGALTGCQPAGSASPSRFAASSSPVAAQSPSTGLDLYLQSLSPPVFSGVVLVAKDFAPIASRAVGIADRAAGRAIRLDTSFEVASLGKLFTAIAIGQLAQQHLVSLDDRVGRYVAGLSADADAITIRQLLGHRGGTGDFLEDPGYLAAKDSIRTVDQLLAAIDLKKPLLFAPGTSWSYSNTGYALLGAVIEKASDTDYYDYVAAHVSAAAGMIHTAFYQKTSLPSGAAIGYLPNGSTNSASLGLRGSPAGGVYSSAPDLLAFHQAWHDGRLLDPALSAEITAAIAPPAPAGAPSPAAGPLPNGLFAGGDAGANAVLGILDSSAETLIVLANGSPPMAEDVAAQIRPLIAPAR